MNVTNSTIHGIRIQDEPFVLVVLGLYLITVLILGFIANRRKDKNSSLDDHFVASGNLGTLALLMTTIASSFSGYTVVGIPGEAYRDGFGVMRWFLGSIGLIALWILYSPRMYNLSHYYKWVSPTDPIKWKFQSKYLSILVSMYIILPQIIYIWSQFSAISTTTEGLTGGNIKGIYGALLMAVIMLIYEFLGGMRGVAYTDVVQGFIMLFGFLSIVIMQGIESGGMFTAIDILREKHPKKTEVPNIFDRFEFLGFQFAIMLATPHYGHIIQRAFSAKSQNSLRISISLMLFVPLVITLPPMTMGWIQLAKDPLYPGLDKSDQTFSVIISEYLQNKNNYFTYATATFLLSASIAAMMSTIDSILLSFVSVITLDIIKPLKEFSYKTFQWIGIAISITITVGCVVVTNFVEIDLSNVLLFQSNVTIQLLPCYFCALFTDSVHWQGLVIGLLGGSFFQVVSFLGIYIPVPGIIGLIINIMLVTSIQILLVSFLRKMSITQNYPEHLLPKDEPYRHKLICFLAFIGFVFASPLYWPVGFQTPDFLGLPVWSFLVIVLCVLFSIGGVLVVKFYWKDIEHEIDDEQSLINLKRSSSYYSS